MIAENLANSVLLACREKNLRLATVESCTGGLIGAALTDIPGSSDVVECGFITYSNTAKMQLVGVNAQTLTKYGAVSHYTAVEMAEGALRRCKVDIAVSVTGIAGPASEDTNKPIGLVYLAVALRNTNTLHFKAEFGDLGREAVRQASVKKALELILQKISTNK